MKNLNTNLIDRLAKNLNEFENFKNEPFVLFEKNNFLNPEDYKILVNEIYSFDNFEKIFTGKGEKKYKSINGNNLNNLKNGVFKEFCNFFLSNKFYMWFKKTHLPYFKNKNKKKFYIKNPYSYIFRLINKIVKIFNIPVSFFFTEIEYSSIKKGGFIPPHTDAHNKRLSFVYYLPNNKEELDIKKREAMGTVFWKPKSSSLNPLKRFNCALLEGIEKEKFYQDYQPFHIATYEENKFVGFIKSDNTWHTVEPFNFDYDRRAIVINVWEAL